MRNYTNPILIFPKYRSADFSLRVPPGKTKIGILYLKGVISQVSLFLMLCTLLGVGACSSPQLNNELNYPEDFESPAKLPVDPPSNLQPNDQQVTLHLIIIADTDDNSIGESTQIDLRNMQKMMGEIVKQSTGRIVLKSLIRDKRITRQELLNVLTRLQAQPRDIIVFHWAGHGHGSPGAKWPYLDTAANTTDFQQVIKILNSKNVRQIIALADCCNAPLIDTRAMYAPRLLRRQYFFPKNIEKMFIRPKINIIASGSKTGQNSLGTNSLGGYFTHNFLITLEEALLDDNNPDSAWEKVMGITRERVLFDTRNKQAPQYEINPLIDREPTTVNKDNIEKIGADTGGSDVINKEKGGTGDFNQLLNKILNEIK
jgi:hypothetical protein